MTSPMTVEERLDATYRLLIMLYPHRWQQQHGDEARSILITRALERGGRLGFADTADLLWHALVARLDGLAAPARTRLPRSVRTALPLITLTIATVGSVIMLGGEIFGAAHRPSPVPYDLMFISGPFLTIGVGIDIGFIMSMVLLLAGQPRAARVVVLATTVLAIWMTYPGGLALYPQPPAPYSAAFAALGLVSLPGPIDRWDRSSRTRAVTGVATLLASATGIGVTVAITGQPGWVPLPVVTSTLLWPIAYVAVPAAILVTIGIALIRAIRRRQFGEILLIAMVATLISGVHAITTLIENGPPTAWLWFGGCLIITARTFAVLRRRIRTDRANPSATPDTTVR